MLINVEISNEVMLLAHKLIQGFWGKKITWIFLNIRAETETVAPWARLFIPDCSLHTASGSSKRGTYKYLHTCLYVISIHILYIFTCSDEYIYSCSTERCFYPFAHFPSSDTLFARLPLAVALSSANTTDTTWLKSLLTHWHCLSWVYSNKQGSTTTHRTSTISRCARTKQRANVLANFGYFLALVYLVRLGSLVPVVLLSPFLSSVQSRYVSEDSS